MIWKFVLGNSLDLSPVAELSQARGRSLGLLHNRGGSAAFNYPMTADYAELINTWTSCILAYRWNWRATQALKAGGGVGNVWDLIWSGYVATIDEDITGNNMTVNAVGWLNRLDKRILRRNRDYIYVAGSGVDDAEIIYDLLSEVNGVANGEHPGGTSSAPIQQSVNTYTVYWPTGSKPNTPTWLKRGTKLPNEGPGGATAYAPAYRGKSYQQYQNILSAITELTDVENGCDIYVDPTTRELNIYRKRRVVRDMVIYGHLWGPNNIAQLGRQIDGTTQINYHVSTGRPGTVPKYQDDITAMQQVGPLEEMASLSDVVDTVTTPTGVSQSILWTYSAGEITLRTNPRIIYSLTPFAYTPDGGVPEPFVDYGIGDQVRFTAHPNKRVQISNQAVRVFGMNVTIDDNGAEKLGQLQFTP